MENLLITTNELSGLTASACAGDVTIPTIMGMLTNKIQYRLFLLDLSSAYFI